MPGINEENMYDSLGPGKFEGSGGRLLSKLYEIGASGMADGDVGDSAENGAFWLFNGARIKGIRRPICAVVGEDSNGFLYLEEFRSSAEVKKRWAEIEAEDAQADLRRE